MLRIYIFYYSKCHSEVDLAWLRVGVRIEKCHAKEVCYFTNSLEALINARLRHVLSFYKASINSA